MLSLPPIDPVRDALQTRVDHFAHLVTRSTIVVAVGVALEGAEIVHDAITWWKRKSREKRERTILKEIVEIFPSGEMWEKTGSSSEHPRWVKRILWLGLLTVVIGVVGEWRYGAKLEDAQNAVHEYDVSKLTEAQEKAVQIEQENIKLRMELAKLQRANGRRYLSPQEKNRLFTLMAPYHLKQVQIACMIGETEPAMFGDDLEEVFARFGFHGMRGWFMPVLRTDMTGKRIDLAPPGITIKVKDPINPPPAAKALKQFFDGLDFASRLSKPLGPDDPLPPSNALRIVIGSK